MQTIIVQLILVLVTLNKFKVTDSMLHRHTSSTKQEVLKEHYKYTPLKF